MGNLTLNGATSGQITLAPTAVAGTNTLTLPAATGTLALTASPVFSGTVTATTVTSPAATALTLQSAGTTAITVDTSQNATFAGTVNMSSSFLRNRIINGDMRIDQRNAGASGTATGVYTVDRWNYGASTTSKLTWGQNLNSVTPPVGFTNYLGAQSSSSYSLGSGDYFGFTQPIEGYNIADLAWGTANAKSITISAWVYSSLTGTFGGALRNATNAVSYPFSYSIPSANTWTYISFTVPGPTIGTWNTTNGTGLQVLFSVGIGSTYSGAAGSWTANNYLGATGQTNIVATNNATWYITGVQLEQGSVATPFERPLYSKQLADCQRYFEMSYDQGTAIGSATSTGSSWAFSFGPAGFTSGGIQTYYKVSKRAAPTVTTYSIVTGASGKVYSSANAADYTTTINGSGLFGFGAYWTQASANSINASYHWTSSAEL